MSNLSKEEMKRLGRHRDRVEKVRKWSDNTLFVQGYFAVITGIHDYIKGDTEELLKTYPEMEDLYARTVNGLRDAMEAADKIDAICDKLDRKEGCDD